jgi:hypothetical protein
VGVEPLGPAGRGEDRCAQVARQAGREHLCLARRDPLRQRDERGVGRALGLGVGEAGPAPDERQELVRRQRVHPAPRPPRALAEQRGQGGHEQRAHDEGVDEDPDGHDEGELAERAQRHDGQQGERAGQRQTGDGHRARGLRRGDRDGLAQSHAPRLVPDASGDEDVVVRAERDEQHGGRERHVVGEVALPEDVLEDDGGQADARQQPERAGRDEVERRDERAHEQREQQDVDEDCHRGDAREVVEHARHGVVAERRLAAVGDLRARQARGAQHAGHAVAQRAQVVDRGRAERVAVEDDGQARRVAVARDGDLRRRRRRLVAGPDHGGDAVSAADQALQARELRTARRDPRRHEVDLGRRDDPRREPAAGRLGGLARLVAGGQRAHEAQPELGRAQVQRGHDQRADRQQRDRQRHRPRCGDPGDHHAPVRRAVLAGQGAGAPHRGERPAEAPRYPLRCPAPRRVFVVSGAGLARLASQPPAEQPVAEQRHERGNERRGHEERDERGGRQPRAEGAEELQMADGEGRGPGRDDQPGGQHDRRDLRYGAACGGPPPLAGAQLPAHRRQVEDRVVGDEPEQQHHDDRLDLLGDGDAGALGQPRQHAHRHRVGRARRRERHQRRAHRAERGGEDQRDQREAGRLDDRQRALDLVELRLARRRGAGDPDDARARAAECLVRIVIGGGGAVVDARVVGEEQVGDRGRVALARRRAHDAVAQRDGSADRGQRGVAALAHGLRGGDLPALRVLRQAARVALHDHGVGRQREAERPRGERLRAGSAAALGGEVVDRRGRGVAETRKRDRRGDDRRHPRQRDEVTQGNHRGGVAACKEAPAAGAR